MSATDGLAVNAKTIRALYKRADTLDRGQLAELARLCILNTNGSPGAEEAAAYYRAASSAADLRLDERFALFCRLLADETPDKTKFAASLTRDPGAGDLPPLRLTALMRNPFTELAFTQFSAHEGGLTSVFQPSFNAACEEVYYGRCGYCVLPQWSSEEGTYAFFHRMLTKYDLKLCAGCDVKNQDTTVRFALLRRGLTGIPGRTQSGSPNRVQLSVVLAPDREIRGFLACTEAVGAHVEYLNVFPLPYAEDRFTVCVTLRLTAEELCALILFLEASENRCTVDGIYEVF